MRRTTSASLAGLTAFAAAVALAGCTVGGTPTPAPSTESPAPTAAPPVETSAPADPTTVDALPGSAFLRVTATADAGGEPIELVLTFSRAATATTTATTAAMQAVLDECPNAIDSQLDIFVNYEPTGVIVSRLEIDGDYPDGMTFAVSAGGQIATIGEGTGVAPSTDEPGMFGCTVPIITGPGDATFTSLLLGDPVVNDRTDLDNQLARGLFGFESDGGSDVPIVWKNCVIQLSSAAQRLATEHGWVLPGEWGDGCLIGDGGSV